MKNSGYGGCPAQKILWRVALMGAHLSAHGLRSLPLSTVAPPRSLLVRCSALRKAFTPRQGMRNKSRGHRASVLMACAPSPSLRSFGRLSAPGQCSALRGGFPAPAPCLLSGRLRFAPPALLNARLGVGAVRLPYGLRSGRAPCPPSLPCSWSAAQPCA